MSSQKFETPLQINLQRSNLLFALLAMMFLGALSLLWVLPWPVYVVLLFSLLLTVSFFVVLDQHVLRRGQQQLKCVSQDSSGQWWLQKQTGEKFTAQLQGDSYLHPRLVVLNFKNIKRRYSVVLMQDSLDRASFRRLRVRLLVMGSDLNGCLRQD